jgi:hypothetical protein
MRAMALPDGSYGVTRWKLWRYQDDDDDDEEDDDDDLAMMMMMMIFCL